MILFLFSIVYIGAFWRNSSSASPRLSSESHWSSTCHFSLSDWSRARRAFRQRGSNLFVAFAAVEIGACETRIITEFIGVLCKRTFLSAGKDTESTNDMFVAGFMWFFVIIWSVGAAKDVGDDEWVHLPNKCEGKRVKYQPWFQKQHSRTSGGLLRLEAYYKILLQFRYLTTPIVILQPLFTCNSISTSNLLFLFSFDVVLQNREGNKIN